MIQLIPIEEDSTVEFPYAQDENVQSVVTLMRGLYSRVGFHEPWIGYLAVHNSSIVGSCGFKGPPSAGSIEIAYFTFPPNEGKGYATEMCRLLTTIATRRDARLRVRARTLKEKNASTRILERNGFVWLGVVNDPDDGEVWEWELRSV